MKQFRIRRFRADFKEELVDTIREGVGKQLEYLGVSINQAYLILTVVDELCCNVLEHSGANWMEMETDLVHGELRIAFRDDGEAFDPTSGGKREPDLEEPKERRLGIYMVWRLTDRFTYERRPEGVNETLITVNLVPKDKG